MERLGRGYSYTVFERLAEGNRARLEMTTALSSHFTSYKEPDKNRLTLLLSCLPPGVLALVLATMVSSCSGEPATPTFQPATPSSPTVGKESITPPADLPKVGSAGLGSETPTTPAEPIKEASPTAKPEPTPTTAEPSPSPTKEVPKDVPCLILPQEYCSRAEVIERKTRLGLTVTQIGFRLPAGVPLMMPIDGQVAPAELSPDVVFYKGNRAYIYDPNNPKRKYIFSGDIKFIDTIYHPSGNLMTLNMKKGEIFGYTQDSGIEMAGYNLVFYITDPGHNNVEEENIEEMQKLFLEAFAKPHRQLVASEAEQSGKGGRINIRVFLDTPPNQ